MMRILKHMGNRLVIWIALFVYIVLLLGGCGGTFESSDGLLTLDTTQMGVEVEEELEDELTTQDETVEAESTQDESGAVTIAVYVCGAVLEEGVYELEEGSRIYEALAAAGGVTEEAMESYLNLAETVSDGQKIYVPTLEEVEAGTFEVSNGSSVSDGSSTSGKVNLNTATLEELTTLTGIGEAKGQAIIDYRTENGSFTSIEELMKVDGIKETTYEAIQDDIEI